MYILLSKYVKIIKSKYVKIINSEYVKIINSEYEKYIISESIETINIQHVKQLVDLLLIFKIIAQSQRSSNAYV